MLDELLQKKKTFIFDLDGTLIDSVWMWNQTDVELLKDLANITVTSKEIGKERDEFLSQVKSPNPYLEYVIYLKNVYSLVQDIMEIQEYRNYIAKELMKTIKLKPYAKELLGILKGEGKCLCLATTGSCRHVEDVLYVYPNTRFLGNNIFDSIVTQNDVINLKPSPDAHLLLQERMGFKKSEAVVIEDSTVGIGAAVSAGIDCITVKEINNLEQDRIKEMSEYYIDSLQVLYDIFDNYRENSPKIRKL